VHHASGKGSEEPGATAPKYKAHGATSVDECVDLLASRSPNNELGYIAKSTRNISIRVHCCHYCSLGFLALFVGKLRRCHAGKRVPSGYKIWEIETERLGLNLSFDSCLLELCEKWSRICQGSRAHASNRRRSGEFTGSLLEEHDITFFRASSNRCNEATTWS
jgi:hypothetical protein